MVIWYDILEVFLMAYFLKKSTQGKRVYLSICESFYSPETKDTKHSTYKTYGRIEKLIEQGIRDPIAFVQAEVDRLNSQRNLEKVSSKSKKISDESPKKLLGYFPLAHLFNTLDVKQHFDIMQHYNTSFSFNVYDIFTSLVYARAVNPQSKLRTYEEVLPRLFKDINFSYDQILEALDFIGSEYEKFVEIFTVATQENFQIDTSKTYFDCTNFYFEIDKENLFQAKGPSKEHRTDPIIGLGLLLDSHMIPIGMRMYPGNESEKPVLRNIINDLKSKGNIEGKTVQIADKGLNCAKNIIEAKNNGDGYLFSKSIRQLPKKEITWVLLNEGYHDVFNTDGELVYKYKECIDEYDYSYIDEHGNKVMKTIKEKRIVTFNQNLQSKQLYEINKMVSKAQKLCKYQAKKKEYGESAKYMDFQTKSGEEVKAALNEKAIEKDQLLAGYNLLVTSEYNATAEELYDAYHNLWRIEESFRIMKTELDARPVYLQKKNRIIGHFFVCYITVLLGRLLQFNLLENKYCAGEIYKFIREFEVVSIGNNRYINMARRSDIIDTLQTKLRHPINNYYLTEKQIKLMHSK